MFEVSMERLPALLFGVPSAITKYPCEGISAMAVEFDNPFCEQPPSPQTKIGYFSAPPRSMGRKIVPSLIPGSALVSTTTLCGPLPVALALTAWGAVQVPELVPAPPPLPAVPAPPAPPTPP